MINVFRIDDRLLHGQVARSWTKQFRIHKIIIINDEVTNDEFSKMTLCLAKPKDVELEFSEVDHCGSLLTSYDLSNERVMCIVSCFEDAKKILSYMPKLKNINIGGLRNKGAEGEVQVTSSVTLSKKDIEYAKEWISQGIQLEIRQIPGEKGLRMEDVVYGK